MAITYSAGAGTVVTTPAVSEATLGDQSQQTGNDEIVFLDDISTNGNGNLESTPTYVGRLVIVGTGTSYETYQKRMIIAETAGTGNTIICTVHEDWDTNPTSSDNAYVAYIFGDVATLGGCSYSTRYGQYELTNELDVGNGTDFAYLQLTDGNRIEADDTSSTTDFAIEVKNNGKFDVGFTYGGVSINGGYITAANPAAGTAEAWFNFESGCYADMYDVVFQYSLTELKIDVDSSSTSKIALTDFKILRGTDDLTLYAGDLLRGSITGAGNTTEYVYIDDTTGNVSYDGVIFSQVDRVTNDATASVTYELLNCVWYGCTNDFVFAANSQTLNAINPIWGSTTTSYSKLNFGAFTGCTVNEKYSVGAVVQESDGTKLQNALVLVYEGTQNDDLVQELTTDSNGEASGSWVYIEYLTASTTTYGAHAIRVDKWLYQPFAGTLTSNERLDAVYSLISDPNISETTQATAKTNGSGTTWNEDTNPSEIFDFTSGSGTLADGMIITFSPSGAVGTITGLQDGDSTAGTIHLKDRNTTAIANGDTFSRTGGTAGTFSGTYTNDSKQPFTIWIDGNDLAMQITYDYLAAISSETTLTADGELLHEWGRDSRARALYKGTSGFYTERSNSKGIFITNFGAGTIAYFTDDAGNTWVPPVSTSVTFSNMKDNSEVRVYLTGTSTEVDGIEDATAGSPDARTFTWAAAATTVVDYKIHNFQPGDEIYETIEVVGYTVPATDTTIVVQQRLDRNAEN